MNATEFLSDETYVMLPTKSNPKVYLPLADKQLTIRAFKLYNPFSRKGKMLKGVAEFLCVHLPFLAKSGLSTVEGKPTLFLKSLEEHFNKEIVSAVYIATAKDKVVLQLQDADGILGYLKYPISAVGKERLLNERNAIEILTQVRRVPHLILSKTYNETPFIVIENLNGTIDYISPSERNDILISLKKDLVFTLSDHPRISDVKDRLKKTGQEEFSMLLTQIAGLSKEKYNEVFEHGDFAPWNLIKTETEIIPFDFEYFEEKGLEHLDEIKYHFQECRLLHDEKGTALISSIASKTSINEFDLIFRIFLIKEICIKAESLESFTFERDLLTLMNASKPLY